MDVLLPKYTKTQKEFKLPRSDLKVTLADRPQSDLKETKQMTLDLFSSHFESLWVTWFHPGVGPRQSL